MGWPLGFNVPMWTNQLAFYESGFAQAPMNAQRRFEVGAGVYCQGEGQVKRLHGKGENKCKAWWQEWPL
jgi:hypothetical protein